MESLMVMVERRARDAVFLRPLALQPRKEHGTLVLRGVRKVALVRSWLAEGRRGDFDLGRRLDTRLTAAQFDRVLGYAKKGGAK